MVIVASRQRGRLSRRQLLAIGVSSSAIQRMIARGHLLVRHPGVYALGHAAAVALAKETDALLAGGPDVRLGSASAGSLWGLTHPGRQEDPVHLIVPGRRGPRLPGVTVHRTTILSDRDIRWREGLPVVSPARALLDLAVILTARSLELAIDRGLVAKVLRAEDLDELLGRSRGHPGHARLAAAAAELGGDHLPTITAAESEELFLDIVRRAELPPPLVGARRFGYEIDFLWPEHGLAVEIDGLRFHGTPRAFHHDRRRDRDLFGHGIIVMRYPWRDLRQRAMAVGAAVAAGLVRAAARGPTEASAAARGPAEAAARGPAEAAALA
jgi:hypothetical protein